MNTEKVLKDLFFTIEKCRLALLYVILKWISIKLPETSYLFFSLKHLNYIYLFMGRWLRGCIQWCMYGDQRATCST